MWLLADQPIKAVAEWAENTNFTLEICWIKDGRGWRVDPVLSRQVSVDLQNEVGRRHGPRQNQEGIDQTNVEQGRAWHLPNVNRSALHGGEQF